jgi:hypothetical protein
MITKTLMDDKVTQTINARMTKEAMHGALYTCFKGSPNLYKQVESRYGDIISDNEGKYSMDHLENTFSMRCEVWSEGEWDIQKLITPRAIDIESESEEEENEYNHLAGYKGKDRATKVAHMVHAEDDEDAEGIVDESAPGTDGEDDQPTESDSDTHSDGSVYED